MRRLLRALSSLRTKLTLSYLLVTVAALVVVQLALFAGLAALANSNVIPRLFSDALRDSAPQLEPYLSESPPDVAGVEQELGLFLVEPEADDQRRLQDSATALPYFGNFVLLDPEERIIGGVPAVSRATVGDEFDPATVQGIEPLLAAALDPGSAQSETYGRGPGGDVLVAAPLRAQDGELLGVVVGVVLLPGIIGSLFTGLAVSSLALTVAAGLVSLIFGFLTAWRLSRRLQRLTGAARAWSGGDFSHTARDSSYDEVGQLARDLNLMARELENLIQTRQELAAVDARNRIARDLHDSVKQQVFAVSLQIATARALLREDPEETESHLKQAGELVGQAQRELNVLIHQMRPAGLADRGLAAALEEYAREWSRSSEIPAEFNVRGERELPLETEQTVFRIAQEALSNVARHSGASKVALDLAYTTDSLALQVSDDGAGFATKEPSEGFGLRSMRERMEQLGGWLTVESAPEEGTRVSATCPVTTATNAKKEQS